MKRTGENSSVELTKLGDTTALPDAALKLLRQAATALDRADFHAAEQALILCLAFAPTHSQPNRLLGVVYQRSRRFEQALACLRQAASVAPTDPLIVIPMMQVLAETGDIPAAIEGLRLLVAQNECAATLAALAEMLGLHGYLDEAVLISERVLAIKPDDARTRLHHALNLFHLGKIQAARSEFRQLTRAGRELAGAWYGLAEMKASAFDKDDLAALRKLGAAKNIVGTRRAMVLHALGKACEDNQHWHAAMDAFVASANISRAAVPWKLNAIVDQLAQLESAFAQPPGTLDPDFGNQTIFIVGMPRSGSTLTEQILSAHPQIEGGSELVDLAYVLKMESRRRGLRYPEWVKSTTPQNWRRLGSEYLERTERWRAHKPRFTDKYPANWMAAELALAMLPSARIIDCRRDPLEMLWSCYKQYFAPGSASWSYTFDDLVAYWKVCEQHCDYLAAKYPDRVRIQSYEHLIENPEEQTRQLLAFCGLPFDAACLQFHSAKRAVRTPSAAQVREPIHRKVSASECYGALLEPLRKLIAG